MGNKYALKKDSSKRGVTVVSEVRSATKFRPTNSIKDRTIGLVALVDEKGKKRMYLLVFCTRT